MQQTDTTINPRSLTDAELIRLAKHYLGLGNLPRSWQIEITERFAQTLD